MRKKETESWNFQVAYRQPKTPFGSVDGARSGEAKTRDEYYTKARQTIEQLEKSGVIPVEVTLFHKTEYTASQSLPEFSNSYCSIQACKPRYALSNNPKEEGKE